MALALASAKLAVAVAVAVAAAIAVMVVTERADRQGALDAACAAIKEGIVASEPLAQTTLLVAVAALGRATSRTARRCLCLALAHVGDRYEEAETAVSLCRRSKPW